MVLEAIACPHCGQIQAVKRHGTTPQGSQRYRCYACCRSFLRHYRHQARLRAVQAQITEMALHGSGIRDTARVLKISPTTVLAHLKKK